MKYILLLFFSFTLLFSITDVQLEKHLSDVDRTSSHLENLIFDGYFEEAKSFSKLANAKYKNNADILCSTGKLYAEEKDLDKAKTFFQRALDVDKTHEMSKDQLGLIADQEAALENKDIEALLELLSDKGLDFLLIFLGFLGAEIMAKRYAHCQNSSIFIKANHYIERKDLTKCLMKRFTFPYRHFIPVKISFICILINLLVLVTISLALLVPFMFVEFKYDITLFTSEPFITMSSAYIESHFWDVLGGLILFTFFSLNLIASLSLSKNETLYEIELVEELDLLVENGAYSDIYEVLNYLQEESISKDDIEDLLKKYSSEAEAILKYYERVEANQSNYY